jgi:hypothetical protein
MAEPGIVRFLDLVVRELGASDARIEIGGKEPDPDRCLWYGFVNGWRVVALFDGVPAPTDRSALERRLATMAESFLSTIEQATGSQSVPPSRTPPDIAGRRLDDELTRLTERAAARGAIVFDLASPVVWGASRTESGDDDKLLEDTIIRVRDAQKDLRAGHTSRFQMERDLECFARPFAGLYVLALVCQGAISEPVAVGALLHALPLIERLVLALPPVDPSPAGAKIMRMPSRK